MKKIIKKVSAIFVLSIMFTSSTAPIALAQYTELGSSYGDGYTDLGSAYGSGYSDISSSYGNSYTNIPSAYGTGYTDIPSSYGTGYTDISSAYGTGYTDIPSSYGTGYTDIPSSYGTGYTNIPSAYGTGYTDIPSAYGTGYTDIPSAYYGTGYTDIPSAYYGSGYTDIPSAYGSNNTSGDYTYTPGYTYTEPVTNYTPSYTSYTPTYTSPVYTTPTYPTDYGYGTSGYTYPTYTYPTYTTPIYTTPVVNTPTVNTPVTCPAGTSMVNGSCVVNTTTCPAGSTRVNGSCVTNTTSCPAGTTLVNGSCVNNTTTCPSGASMVNGSCVVNTTSCPNGTTLVNGSCVTNTTSCPSGTSLVNGSCVINTTSCPAGSALINGTCTIQTVSTTYTCPNGSVVSYSYQCPVVYTTPTYTYPTYTYPTYTTPSVTYQTCWDGSVIPNTAMCPAQYKVCANGTSVPVSQTCYYGNTRTPYTPPQSVKFNNVVTSVATEVTNKSGRCNGIGLIANGASSTGWFEYGETSKLGRTTATANIGRADTAPFSNVLANLKSNTTYYCRAVMQNQYGTVKGEIVGFTTKSKTVSYVKPVTTSKKVSSSTTKKATKKNEIICSDGTTTFVKNESQAEILNQGQKLIALQMDKVEGNLTADSSVLYRLSYKNLSDSRLTGVIVKVTIPQEISFSSSNFGNYDQATHMLTLNQDTMDSNTEGVISWAGKVTKDATLGKSIVTTAYVSYTVPSTSVQDEVTAYVVGSILPSVDNGNSSTGAKHVIGADEGRGFLPNSLVEWLALFAIMCILFILGRSIHASYKGESEHAH